MKKFIIFCTSIFLSNIAFPNTFYTSEISGYGIIEDEDGYVNLRLAPNSSSEIVDKISNGSLVYCYNEGGRIDNYCYSETNRGLGYIHTSRIKILENKFKTIVKGNDYILSHNENKIFIHTDRNRYKDICFNDRLNCIDKNKIKDIKNIDLDSHVAYLDKETGKIFLTASFGNKGNLHNIVWTIGPNKSTTRWIYSFKF